MDGERTEGGVPDLLGRLAWAQKETLAMARDYLQPQRFEPVRLAGALPSPELLAEPRRAFRFFLPGEQGLVAWQEEANKAAVYFWVSQSSLLLGISEARDLDLRSLVDRAYSFAPFPALWAVEGLGNDYTGAVWERDGRSPRELFLEPGSETLPERSLLMLHAGFGLAAARRALRRLRGEDPGEKPLRTATEEFLDLCRANCRPGYTGAAWESLGLVTETFYPWLVPSVARALAASPEGVDSFFWHGVGRARYFALGSFLPCGDSTWRAFEAILRRPPGELRRSSVAGLAWAVVLVNQRTPRVVADLVARHGETLAGDDAFANGVASAVTMRRATTPGADFLETFPRYRPPEAGVAALWEELVARPCRLALEVVYPRLAARKRLDEVFRYHPLSELEGAA